MVASSHIGIKP
jgi:hypothetical protein